MNAQDLSPLMHTDDVNVEIGNAMRPVECIAFMLIQDGQVLGKNAKPPNGWPLELSPFQADTWKLKRTRNRRSSMKWTGDLKVTGVSSGSAGIQVHRIFLEGSPAKASLFEERVVHSRFARTAKK